MHAVQGLPLRIGRGLLCGVSPDSIKVCSPRLWDYAFNLVGCLCRAKSVEPEERGTSLVMSKPTVRVPTAQTQRFPFSALHPCICGDIVAGRCMCGPPGGPLQVKSAIPMQKCRGYCTSPVSHLNAGAQCSAEAVDMLRLHPSACGTDTSRRNHILVH